MFCRFCGAPLENGAKFCTSCGAKVDDTVQEQTVNAEQINNSNDSQSNYGNPYVETETTNTYSDHIFNTHNNANNGQQTYSDKEDEPSSGLNLLAFLIPLAGLIMYCIMKKDTPIKAKEIGKWTLIGFIVEIAVEVVRFFVYGYTGIDIDIGMIKFLLK